MTLARNKLTSLAAILLWLWVGVNPAAAQLLITPNPAGGEVANQATPVDYYDGLRALDAGQPELAMSIWFAASRRGDPASLYRLGLEFESGTLVPADRLLSHYYFKLAAVARHDAAGEAAGRSEALLTVTEREAVESAVEAFGKDFLEPPEPLSVPLSAASLFDAAEIGDAAGVRAALDYGVNANSLTEEGWSALMLASGLNHADVVRMLVERGADLSIADPEGFTALHIAAATGSEAAVTQLLSSGAIVLAESSAGSSPLELAERAGNVSLVSTLRAAASEQVVRLSARLNELGYDVDDGAEGLGERLREQVATFSNQLRFATDEACEHFCEVRQETTDILSASVVASILSAPTVRSWSVAITDAIPGRQTERWLKWGCCDKQSIVESFVNERCQSGNCTVLFAIPAGSCVAMASRNLSNRNFWSAPRSTSEKAEEEARSLCSAGGKESQCSLEESYCVGPG
jgi:TPR repeat protein